MAKKLKGYRDQFQITISELSKSTGISGKTLESYEAGEKLPTGDEILIFADFYMCDYKFFISNEKLSSLEQTEILFRKHGNEFSKTDRWAVQEVLFLLENTAFLSDILGINHYEKFEYTKAGTYFKAHGIEAAATLRKHLGYDSKSIPMNIYQDFNKAGVQVFRRKLENSNISGLYLNHPVAGKCVLINYNEDIYRQRFTAAHEMGHAILDSDEDVVVSFHKLDERNLSEIRANMFASHYLMPPDFLKQIPEPNIWDERKAIEWASKLKVSTEALANALMGQKTINIKIKQLIKSVKVPKSEKIDPEIPDSFSPIERERKEKLLKLGLSSQYVTLCFKAYQNQLISAARMADMLLTNENGLDELFRLYKEVRRHEA